MTWAFTALTGFSFRVKSEAIDGSDNYRGCLCSSTINHDNKIVRKFAAEKSVNACSSGYHLENVTSCQILKNIRHVCFLKQWNIPPKELTQHPHKSLSRLENRTLSPSICITRRKKWHFSTNHIENVSQITTVLNTFDQLNVWDRRGTFMQSPRTRLR